MTIERQTSWMWARACALLDEAESRHRRFFNLLAASSATPAWEPPANVFSLGDDLYVEIALPGARIDDVVVKVTATGLSIETSVASPAFAAGVNVVRLEIPYGRMRRRIELPPGRYALREHRMENGCLSLHLEVSP